MENGKWKMESGKWKIENGKWKMESGKWKGLAAVGFKRLATYQNQAIQKEGLKQYFFVILSKRSVAPDRPLTIEV
ncbi:MAG: hypothetical protein WBC65_09215 [Ignavibacteria bacterium]